MKKKLACFFHRYLLWLFMDVVIVGASLYLAWQIRVFAGNFDPTWPILFGVLSAFVYLAMNYLFRLYHRLWHYASSGEVIVIFISTAISTVFLIFIDVLGRPQRIIPISIVPLMGLFVFIGFVAVRYRSRLWLGFTWRWRKFSGQIPTQGTKVLIVGAGEAGQLLAWRLINESDGSGFYLMGFVDDDREKHGMRIHGLPVFGDRNVIPQLVNDHKVDMIIIAIYNLPNSDFRAILDIAESTPAAIKIIPNIFHLLQGQSSTGHIRNVTVNDLLGRETVEINQQSCHSLIANKTVLVTGAAGSIGSELCYQIARFSPEKLIILDNNETGVHDLFIDLDHEGISYGTSERNGQQRIFPVVADVTNQTKMRAIFATYHPEVVFHAAAYKHVPLMELHPDEAVRVNVLGTAVTASLSSAYGAERFVLVSTDKAINPESVMGATKRIAEMVVGMIVKAGPSDTIPDEWNLGLAKVLGSNPQQKTLFTAVRFGNVLGSRGSVVPTFERQIDQGGPVTVTHPDMTRFLMSIPEAVSLIIQAATLTNGSDVFMLDMGQSVRIDELARRLIRMRGLRPDVDIPIIYTGTRPGEKMHEELLGEEEDQSPTAHPQIVRILGSYKQSVASIKEQVDHLIAMSEDGNADALIDQLWQIVRSEDRPVVGKGLPTVLSTSTDDEVSLGVD